MAKNVRLFVSVLSLSAISVSALAQIPNAGFENWAGDTLSGWWTNNVPSYDTTITRSAVAHSGTSAVRGEVVDFFTIPIQPIIQSGVTGDGFAYSQRPAAITGYYKFFPALSSGDQFAVNASLFNGGVNGTPVGGASVAFLDTVSSYTQFSASFDYQSTDSPDTCFIQFQILGPDSAPTPHIGSYFLLDDLAFTGVVRVVDIQAAIPKAFQLNQNYPNPFNPTTTITFTVPSDGIATLTVFNLLGQQVATLLEGPVSSGKIYHAIFNAPSLASGVYFSRLEFIASGSSSGKTLMRKMALMK